MLFVLLRIAKINQFQNIFKALNKQNGKCQHLFKYFPVLFNSHKQFRDVNSLISLFRCSLGKLMLIQLSRIHATKFWLPNSRYKNLLILCKYVCTSVYIFQNMSFTVPHYFELVMITNLAFEDVSWFIFAKSARVVFLVLFFISCFQH